MVVCNLRNILAQRKLSQRALARRTRVHRQTIAGLYHNTWGTINRTIMDSICMHLRITPQEFFIRENEDD